MNTVLRVRDILFKHVYLHVLLRHVFILPTVTGIVSLNFVIEFNILFKCFWIKLNIFILNFNDNAKLKMIFIYY